MRNRSFNLSPLAASLIVTGAAALMLFLQICYSGGGSIEQESAGFLIHYLADRPLPAAIFDPARNDWGMYQARELSYFFDYLDARFIAFSVRHGVLHFYALSAFVMLLLTVFVQQYAVRKLYPELPSAFATALSVAFILTPCAYQLSYFRSAKFGCALFFTVAGLLSFALLQRRLKRPWLGVAGIVFSLLAASLFDRQGAFFAAGYCGAAGLLLLFFLRRYASSTLPGVRRILAPLAAGALAVVVLGTFYNLRIAPELIWRYNGYAPDFDYQNVTPFSLHFLRFGLRFFFGNVGHAVTGLTRFPAVLAGFCLVLAAGGVMLYGWRKLREPALPLGVYAMLAALGGMIFAAFGMVARHLSILMPEVMYGTYFLPAWALLCTMLPTVAATAARLWPARNARLNPVLLAPALAVAVHLGGYLLLHHTDGETEHQQIFQSRMPLFRRALTEPAWDYRHEALPARMEYLIRLFRQRP